MWLQRGEGIAYRVVQRPFAGGQLLLPPRKAGAKKIKKGA